MGLFDIANSVDTGKELDFGVVKLFIYTKKVVFNKEYYEKKTVAGVVDYYAISLDEFQVELRHKTEPLIVLKREVKSNPSVIEITFAIAIKLPPTLDVDGVRGDDIIVTVLTTKP